jgi:YHS domain-containing protein
MRYFENKFTLLAKLVLSLVFSAQAQDKNIFTVKNIAIDGYDPVAYFKAGKAVEGSSSILSRRGGVIYNFSTTKNKALFDKTPDKYLPVYGGYCAYAMGVDGSKVKIDPETFKIVDDKLYLFYNFVFTNTLPKWNHDESNLKKKADSYWKELTN